MDIDTMEAGRELDALVAEKVFGYKVEFGYRDYPPEGDPGYMTCSPPPGCKLWAAMYWAIPKYSTSISAAWEVVEKMAYDIELVRHGPVGGGWKCEIGAHWWAYAEALPLAVCRAALKAVTTPS